MHQHKQITTHIRSLTIYLSVILLLGINYSTSASDWAQFRGLHRNAVSSESGLRGDWAASPPPLLWQQSGLGIGYASAVVVDGTVYLNGLDRESGEGILSALGTDGAIEWQANYGKEWDGTHPGSHYPPTITSGKAYVLSGYGVLHCLSARDGSTIWQRDVAGDFAGPRPVMGFAESILVDDERVYCTPGGKEASVVALNPSSGETVWTSKGLSDPSAYCAPILVNRGGTKLLITLTASRLVALDPANGTLIWQVPFDAEEEMQNHAIAPVYHEGLLYATSGHREGGVLYQLSEDGSEIHRRWSDEILNPLHGGVVIWKDHLFGANARGRWSCLSLKDGSLQWQDRGVGKGSLLYADGHLYCYGEKGTIALVEATPAAYREKGRITVEGGDGPHWAHPSIADGVLYLRHGDMLHAYDIRATPTRVPVPVVP